MSAVWLLLAAVLAHGVGSSFTTAADFVESNTFAWNSPTPGRSLSQTEEQWAALDDLFDGVLRGDTSQVQEALDAGADVNAQNINKQTALWGAVALGNLEVTQLLLDNGANPNITDISKYAPLTIAAIQDEIPDQLGLLQALIDNGASLEAKAPRSENGETALGLVAGNGNVQAVKLLLEAGADPETANSDGQTPLSVASFFGHSEVVRELISSSSVELNTKDEGGNTPLHYSAQAGNDEVTGLLIQAGADVDAVNEGKETPLMVSIRWGGDMRTVTTLISGGADSSIKDEGGLAPIHDAATLGYSQVIDALVKGGGDVDAQTDGEELTPLHLAVETLKGQTVLELLGLGANVGLTTSTSLTPLHVTPLNMGSEGIALALIASGSNIDALSNSSWTPLHFAAYWGNEKVMEVLVERGANVEAKAEDGKTPRDLVCQCEEAEVLADLSEHLKSARYCPVGACESEAQSLGLLELLKAPEKEEALLEGSVQPLNPAAELEISSQVKMNTPKVEEDFGEDIIDFEVAGSPALESLPVFPHKFGSAKDPPRKARRNESGAHQGIFQV
ncbi:hypothetical protein BSKO_13350 [Bryopsis sp. KO-2023]|nr:hypothetical protein BSKO_13350 [Bryopsis sp. KO-2023]